MLPVPSLWPLAKVSAHTKARRCPPPPADLRDLFRKPCSEGRGWLSTTECLPRFASQGLLMAAEDSPVENVGQGWLAGWRPEVGSGGSGAGPAGRAELVIRVPFGAVVQLCGLALFLPPCPRPSLYLATLGYTVQTCL